MDCSEILIRITNFLFFISLLKFQLESIGVTLHNNGLDSQSLIKSYSIFSVSQSGQD